MRTKEEIDRKTETLIGTELWLRNSGPHRVIIDEDARAVPPGKAAGIPIDVIFIRDDGWTLGAPLKFAGLACSLWAGSWLAFVMPRGAKPRPVLEWQIPRCIVHPEREAEAALNVPCAPDGKVYVCEACSNEENMARVFKAYQCGHAKQITAFKQENPGS